MDLHRDELEAMMRGHEVVTVAEVVAAYLRPPAWQADAACRGVGVDAFFPAPGQSNAPAKALCARCTVADACRDYAVSIGAVGGIWGGVTAKQARSTARR